jgi:hypothetical protein
VANIIIPVVCPDVIPETVEETLTASNIAFRFPAESDAMLMLAMQMRAQDIVVPVRTRAVSRPLCFDLGC